MDKTTAPLSLHGWASAHVVAVRVDQIRCPFGDGEGRRIGVAAGDPWHDRSVDDTEPVDAVEFDPLAARSGI